MITGGVYSFGMRSSRYTYALMAASLSEVVRVSSWTMSSTISCRVFGFFFLVSFFLVASRAARKAGSPAFLVA